MLLGIGGVKKYYHIDRDIRGMAEHKLHPLVDMMLRMGHKADVHELWRMPQELPRSVDASMRGKVSVFKNKDMSERVHKNLGSVLRAMFPAADNQVIQEVFLTYKHMYDAKNVKFTTSTEEMVRLLNSSSCPTTCMNNADIKAEYARRGRTSPYEAYDAALGWAMAYIEYNGAIIDRALVHKPSKTYVRTYNITKDYGASERLAAALTSLGYIKLAGWQGVCIKLLSFGEKYPVEFGVPYLDGECGTYKLIKRDGDRENLYMELYAMGSKVSKLATPRTANGIVSWVEHICDTCGKRSQLRYLGDGRYGCSCRHPI